MIAVVEELKLLYRRIRGCSCRTAIGSRQSAVNPLLGAVALEYGILDSLADDEGSGAGDAGSYAAAVFFELGDDPCFSGEYVLGAEIAVFDCVEPVDVDGFSVLASLDCPLSRIIIEEDRGAAAVRYGFDPVLFVPRYGPVGSTGLAGPAGHVAVCVVGVHLVPGVGDGVGPGASIGVFYVVVRVPGFGEGVRALVYLVRLELVVDVTDYIIGQFVCVQRSLVVRRLMYSVRLCQLVEVVVGEVLLGGAAELAAGRDGGGVVGIQDVADEVVGVVDVLDDAACFVVKGHGVEVFEPPRGIVVGVPGVDAVAGGHLGSLLDL